MILKGTLGTWEQVISNRHRAVLLVGAILFPAGAAMLGTWEQKWPIPMQENPRACGIPLPLQPVGGIDGKHRLGLAPRNKAR